MLSVCVLLDSTWGYTVQSIVSSLVERCNRDGLDPRTTYVWICCLCINVSVRTEPAVANAAMVAAATQSQGAGCTRRIRAARRVQEGVRVAGDRNPARAFTDVSVECAGELRHPGALEPTDSLAVRPICRGCGGARASWRSWCLSERVWQPVRDLRDAQAAAEWRRLPLGDYHATVRTSKLQRGVADGTTMHNEPLQTTLTYRTEPQSRAHLCTPSHHFALYIRHLAAFDTWRCRISTRLRRR